MSAEPVPLRRIATAEPAAAAAEQIAAGLLAGLAEDAARVVTLALSGGSSAPGLLAALADRDDVDWGRVAVLQVDERVAPDGHDDRNAGPLRQHLVEDGPLDAANLHLMPVASGAPEDAAHAYDATLRRLLEGRPLDVVHLGMGGDGHTASLIPHDEVLDVSDRWVAATRPYQGRRRVTLTFPALAAARRIVWYVPAADRGPVIRRLLEGDPSIPAGRVRRDRAVLVTSPPATEKR